MGTPPSPLLSSDVWRLSVKQELTNRSPQKGSQQETNRESKERMWPATPLLCQAKFDNLRGKTKKRLRSPRGCDIIHNRRDISPKKPLSIPVVAMYPRFTYRNAQVFPKIPATHYKPNSYPNAGSPLPATQAFPPKCAKRVTIGGRTRLE